MSTDDELPDVRWRVERQPRENGGFPYRGHVEVYATTLRLSRVGGPLAAGEIRVGHDYCLAWTRPGARLWCWWKVRGIMARHERSLRGLDEPRVVASGSVRRDHERKERE